MAFILDAFTVNKFSALRKTGAFTLIEVLAVVIIISILFAASQPLIGESARKTKESVLKSNLRGVRDTIARFYKDHERYPESLQELVDKKYIMALPLDPVTEKNDTWIIIPSSMQKKDVYDIKSGARGESMEKVKYENL
ncbi:MAG TPA: type II secretion system protein [Candidatus Wallbacteria bacterium]|nr:type II secretion system protein [Candidatus Wallbacteria bacterium]